MSAYSNSSYASDFDEVEYPLTDAFMQVLRLAIMDTQTDDDYSDVVTINARISRKRMEQALVAVRAVHSP